MILELAPNLFEGFWKILPLREEHFSSGNKKAE